MEEKINKIELQLESLEKKLDRLLKIHDKMDSHINFIEETYDTLRSPIDFMKNKINLFIGSSSDKELPSIKHTYNKDNDINDNNNN